MKKIGEILLSKGYVSEQDIQNALFEQQSSYKKIGKIFVEKNVITDDDLAQVLAEQLKIPFIKLSEHEISENLISLFVQSYMRKNRFIPIEVVNKKLVLATDNPINPDLILEASFITNMEVAISVVKTGELEDVFNKLFGQENLFFDLKEDFVETPSAHQRNNEDSTEVNSKPVVRLINAIILDAIKLRASDIHFEPQENTLLVRYRIDGFLHEHIRIPKKSEKAVISRIKIMAKMDITQSRKSQDGSVQLYVAKKDISLRVSTLPIINGEKVVIRILDKSRIEVKLDSLGLSGEHIRVINSNSAKSQGIILVTGPTGSGKTTTLYSILQELDYSHLNVSTIEDPIEYTIKGINQTQIDIKSGITFASALRTLLRQDPNIVLIGEIRDIETATTAFKAAMTGHLILSTVHTNDEISTIVRLRDLEIPPYLIADGLLLVIAQRLVRRVCTSCGIEYEPDEEEAAFLRAERGVKLLKANERGCEKCSFTGYKGVTGIYGILEIDSTIKELIEKSSAVNLFNDYLKKRNYKSVLDDGIANVLNKTTTLSEIKRVLDIDRFENMKNLRPANASKETISGMKVLVVDDIKTIRILLRALLESEGFVVDEADNGRSAFNALLEGNYCMAITDVKMPEMDGFQLLAALRDNPETKNIPVIMLTSNDDSVNEIKGLESGADDYIVKPIDPEKVILRVKNIFRRMGYENGKHS
ncbi:MAG: ATPase, T2SS/T4P/T4SS family [bacterium]